MIQSKNVNYFTFRAARYAAVLKGFYGCMQALILIWMEALERCIAKNSKASSKEHLWERLLLRL